MKTPILYEHAVEWEFFILVSFSDISFADVLLDVQDWSLEERSRLKLELSKCNENMVIYKVV